MTYPIVLQDAFKRFTLDQDKVLPPGETVRRFRRKLENLDLDILKETRRIDNGRLGIPVYFSVCGRDAAALTGTRKQMGKGATPEQAEASAVMELAERFSFFSFRSNPENFMVATREQLRDRAMPFDLIAASVHDTSEDIDVARRIFDQLPLHWTRGYSLTREAEMLIPFSWFFTINEFNGPSAGNCVEEALSQGICEIVERHVSALVSRGRLTVPLIDPDSATDPMVCEMIAKYRRAGIVLYISDFSLDMGIPTVGAAAYDPSTFPRHSEIVWTAGTTPDPQKALSRTLTEVAQLAGDFNTSANYVASGLPKPKSIAELDFITKAPRKVNIGSLADLSNDNIRMEVEALVQALARRDMEVFVIDTTHSDLGVPAFYTIIPGAHFRERAVGTSVGMFVAKLIAEGTLPARAIARLTEIDRMMPGRYYVSFYLGKCHLDMGKTEAATRHLERALALNPTHQDMASIYSYLGVCHKERGRYQEALEVLSRGKHCDADRTDILNLMGFCHFKLKQHSEAIECFKRVIELDPGSAIDYANIASNYRDMGKRAEAVEYYRMALELDPGIDFARENLEKLISRA
jgi:ribosomal protein S12 methylthiotransferase accessory factor